MGPCPSTSAAVTGARQILTDLARLSLDERLTRVTEHEARMLEQVRIGNRYGQLINVPDLAAGAGGYDGSIWPHHDGADSSGSTRWTTGRSEVARSRAAARRKSRSEAGPDQGDTGIRQTVVGPIQAVRVGPALAVIARAGERGFPL